LEIISVSPIQYRYRSVVVREQDRARYGQTDIVKVFGEEFISYDASEFFGFTF
jgi:hypothetical protein